MAQNLVRFHEIGQLPSTVQLDCLDEGEGVEATLTANKAQWHKSCALLYNNTELRQAEKRLLAGSTLQHGDTSGSHKHTRSQSATQDKKPVPVCFFCGNPAGADGPLHEASMFEMEKHVRSSAAIVEDHELLAKLSMGDMVALESKYHNKCRLKLHNRARAVKLAEAREISDTERTIYGIVFAELVMYIEEVHLDT